MTQIKLPKYIGWFGFIVFFYGYYLMFTAKVDSLNSFFMNGLPALLLVFTGVIIDDIYTIIKRHNKSTI